MENQVITFTAQHPSETQWLWAGIIAVVVAGAGLYALYRKKASRSAAPQQAVLGMLFFFMAILGTGSAVFSALSIYRLKPLTIAPKGIQFQGEEIPWSAVQRISMVHSQQKTALNANGEQTRMLYIECSGDRAFLFSEASYPVSQILGAIRLQQPTE